MPITSRRKGPYPSSKAEANLWFASGRLHADWRRMTRKELESYLRHIIIAERKCMPQRNRRSEPPTNRWLQPRLRRRRLEVAAALIAQGGRVSGLVTSRALPKQNVWPGVMALVGARAINLAGVAGVA